MVFNQELVLMLEVTDKAIKQLKGIFAEGDYKPVRIFVSPGG